MLKIAADPRDPPPRPPHTHSRAHLPTDAREISQEPGPRGVSLEETGPPHALLDLDISFFAFKIFSKEISPQRLLKRPQ